MSIDLRKEFPRLPLTGNLDLTYRCNNNCLHCWLWLPDNASQVGEELTYDEIRLIADEARSMGCQSWAISGGEPMLRPDFLDIFEYLTHRAVNYSINTNGTLITPRIAQLLTRKGRKMVALYGATAEVHDRVTRNPGSFAATMQGFAYLKEAGAHFIVQIVPMRANYHQYQQMIELAKTLSPHYRLGADWLYLSACRSETRNRQIIRQRLDPATVIALNEPFPADSPTATASVSEPSGQHPCDAVQLDDRLFASCIAARRDFHIDPYGKMSFCYYIKDPALCYDLRQGTFRQAWDEFIPSLAELVRGGQEYRDNCGSCQLRQDCRWCAVYAYLEHGRYSARVDYLCKLASEAHRFKEDWNIKHIRYFQTAGITFQVTADFPITDDTFPPNIRSFEVDGPGQDNISIRHISSIPPRSAMRLGKRIYRKDPWAIYKGRNSWVYRGTTSDNENQEPNLLAIFNEDQTKGTIYRKRDFYLEYGLFSLTTFSSDQILLARILADRQGCVLHASGIIMDNKGLLFVGHSGAGKSTMLKILRGQGELLCDDRIILRRWPDSFHIHGTWSHGELLDVSPSGAPLRAILYLEQAAENELIPLKDQRERLGMMLSHVVKPLATADWWEKTLELAGRVAAEVPAYQLRFDKSGRVVDLLRAI